jgi:sugar lactone lactonase YvrE
VIGPNGDYYLVAWHNWKIKRFDKATMETSIAVGTTQGFLGDGGPATAAKMDLPSSLVFDFDGNMFISDQANQRIRKVTPDGTISTFAGSTRGYADGIGAAAQFSLPAGPDAGPGGRLTINDDRTMLYMVDTFNHRIRSIDLATGEVKTIGGTGTAGYSGDGGPATAAQFNAPADIYLTHDQDLLIADSENNVIRKIDAAGVVSTIVGTGERGVSENATPALQAKLDRPYGVVYDEANHTLYIADTFNNQVKRVELDHAE